MQVKYAPENLKRALFAARTLVYYESRRQIGTRGNPTDTPSSITDLLTGLRHCCALNDEDFDKHLNRSLEHFNAEIAE